ncbi:MAG: hypothetical protein L0G46_01315 [Kocuria sp.]|nr:hypothetical protein [Kocuria sp.]
MKPWTKIFALSGVAVISIGCWIGALGCGTWFLAHLSELGNSRITMNLLSMPVIALGLGVIGFYGVLGMAAIMRIPSKVAK